MHDQLPSIFGYIDYRKFLGDYREARRTVDPGFTHAYICIQLGQRAARTYYSNVVSGRRDVTPAFVDRFIDLLELNSDEARYFRALVTYNQSTSPHEREDAFDRIVRLNRTPKRIIEPDAYEYYSSWRHAAIRAALDTVDVRDNLRELASLIQPKITVNQARKSVALLKRLGLVAPDSRGFLKPTDRAITTADLVRDEVVRRFQAAMLEHARDVLLAAPDQRHRNVGMTISLSEKAYDRVVERIQQARAEIRSIAHKDEEHATAVYQVNMNLFPLTRKPR